MYVCVCVYIYTHIYHICIYTYIYVYICIGFPGGAVVKNPPAKARDARDTDSIPGSGRSSGIANGNLLQYSRLKNSKDRGAWGTTVYGVVKS